MTVWIPVVCEIAVLAFFPLAAALAYCVVRRSELPASQQQWLGGAMLFSFAIKILLASEGHNFDVESYRIVSDILQQGHSVYANTIRYNYGPLWFWILAGFGHLAPAGTGEHFHMWIAAFLGMVDVLIAAAIARAYSWKAALVFLLVPIGPLISGLHSQFDNLAVLLALAAWLLIRKGNPQRSTMMLSAASMGVSLVAKHVLFLFPAWLVFWKPLGKLQYRILYAALAYGLFGASFLPWWGDPDSRAGILKNVIGYTSTFGLSFIGYSIDVFRPLNATELLHWAGVGKPVWMVLMLIVGVVLARKGRHELFLCYLLLLYATTPAINSQYEAIPLLAVAVFYRSPGSWAFLIAATAADFLSRHNAGGIIIRLTKSMDIAPLAIGMNVYTLPELFGAGYAFFIVASQLCIGVLLWQHLRHREDRECPPMLQLRNAAACIAAGGLPAFILGIRQAFGW